MDNRIDRIAKMIVAYRANLKWRDMGESLIFEKHLWLAEYIIDTFDGEQYIYALVQPGFSGHHLIMSVQDKKFDIKNLSSSEYQDIQNRRNYLGGRFYSFKEEEQAKKFAEGKITQLIQPREKVELPVYANIKKKTK